MKSPRPRRARGFTLLELLVVLAILGALIGLLLPAVQQVRKSANRTVCQNNLKQLALAFHNVHDANEGQMPPGVGRYPRNSSRSYGNGLFYILPFLEQGNLYEQSNVDGYYFAGQNDVFTRPVKSLLCPSDPSTGRDGVVADKTGQLWGASSYAGNAQVFCAVNDRWELIGTENYPRLEGSFPNGTSNTILLAEKYARCTNYAFAEGGNFWAYWVTGPTVQPLHPAFAVSWTYYSVGPSSLFLVRPTPYLGNCDPSLSSTSHQNMHVALADGSIRSLSPAISGTTWWAACDPQTQDVLGPDW